MKLILSERLRCIIALTGVVGTHVHNFNGKVSGVLITQCNVIFSYCATSLKTFLGHFCSTFGHQLELSSLPLTFSFFPLILGPGLLLFFLARSAAVVSQWTDSEFILHNRQAGNWLFISLLYPSTITPRNDLA